MKFEKQNVFRLCPSSLSYIHCLARTCSWAQKLMFVLLDYWVRWKAKHLFCLFKLLLKLRSSYASDINMIYYCLVETRFHLTCSLQCCRCNRHAGVLSSPGEIFKWHFFLCLCTLDFTTIFSSFRYNTVLWKTGIFVLNTS